MKLHISPKIFKEIIKKSYNLDSVYLLKLIEDEQDIAPLYKDSMKISSLYQGLIRKGLISREDEKITVEGKNLLEFISIYNNYTIDITLSAKFSKNLGK